MDLSSVSDDVYLNLPYDSDLLLAYIAAAAAHGLVPRTALEITGGTRRLDRIADLIHNCRYSVHELTPPEGAPRYNMPFELGIAVEFERNNPQLHTWFVFETTKGRIERTLSDLNGSDIQIHAGKPKRLFSEFADAFVRTQRKPSMAEMDRIFLGLQKALPAVLRQTRSRGPFKPRVFTELRTIAAQLSQKLIS